MRKLFGASVASGALLLAAAGCGSSGPTSSGSTSSPPAPSGPASSPPASSLPSSVPPSSTGGGAGTGGAANLASAYQSAIAANSASVKLRVDATSAAADVTVSGDGAFDWSKGQGQLITGVDTAGRSVEETTVVDNGAVYVMLPSQYAAATGGKPWIKVDISGLTTGSVGQNPAQILSLLSASSSSVIEVGRENVDGVATTHYRSQVDPTKAAADAGPALQQAFATLKSMAGTAPLPVDVWIDRDGRPVRMVFAVTLQSPPPGAPSAAATAFPETSRVQMDLSDWGRAVSVTVPPPSEVSSVSVPGL